MEDRRARCAPTGTPNTHTSLGVLYQLYADFVFRGIVGRGSG